MVCALKRTDTKGTFFIFPRVLIIKEVGGFIIIIIIIFRNYQLVLEQSAKSELWTVVKGSPSLCQPESGGW